MSIVCVMLEFRRSLIPVFGFILWFAMMASASSQTVQDIPRIEGESLAGQKVVLPDAAAGKVAVLILGFSKASKNPTSAWAKRISADFGARAGFELFQLPVLEDVPRFIRGMVISGIKKGVPENMRDHFVPILEGEADLKKAVNYREPDDAYIVVLDRTGKIVQQTHGAPDDASYSLLKAEIESLLKGP